MGKWQNDTMLDTGLLWVANNSDRMFLCAGAPANYTAADTGGANNCGNVALTPGNAGGDFTGPADGDVSGRKITVANQSITIAANGTANHVVLANSTNSQLVYMTTFANQVVTANNVANVGAWDIELADPTA